MKIEFFVPGEPKGAGSKTAFCLKKGGQYTGRAIVTDSSGKAGKDWRASIVQVAFQAMKEADVAPFSGPLILTAGFNMPRPKSHYGKGGWVKATAPDWHTVRPDATKLVRALEDALTKVLWLDDALVCRQIIEKRYGTQRGCRVTVESMGQSAATPAVSDQDKIWVKLDGAGRPLGNFTYYSGKGRSRTP